MPAVLSTAAPAPKAFRDNSRSDATRPAPLRILVAEDCVFNQKLVGNLLKKLGHRVEIVADGVQAANAAQHGEYDVIFLDIAMPRLDGVGAAARIRREEQSRGRRVPILALADHDGEEVRTQGGPSHFDGVVSKPIDPSQLQAELHSTGGSGAQRMALRTRDDAWNEPARFTTERDGYVDAGAPLIACAPGEP